MRNVINAEEVAEFKRLWQQLADASRKAQMVLIFSEMGSREFAEADAKVARLWKRIRQIQGEPGATTLN